MALAQRLGWLHADDPDGTLRHIRDQIETHELRTLLVSRLVPGGRIPVLLAAALGGHPWQKFAVASIAATTIWSATYAAIGLLGQTLPNRTIALVVVVVAALLVSVVIRGVRWLGRDR